MKVFSSDLLLWLTTRVTRVHRGNERLTYVYWSSQEFFNLGNLECCVGQRSMRLHAGKLQGRDGSHEGIGGKGVFRAYCVNGSGRLPHAPIARHIFVRVCSAKFAVYDWVGDVLKRIEACSQWHAWSVCAMGMSACKIVNCSKGAQAVFGVWM